MAVRRSARKSNKKTSIVPLMTHFEVIVDRSGSMETMKRNDVYTPIEKMKELIADQIKIAKETDGIIKISLTSFDDTSETYFTNKDIGELANISDKKWIDMLKPRFTTRLIDTAIERLSSQKEYIENFSNNLSKEVKHLDPIVKRVFVLYTDGYDNVSVKNSKDLNVLLKEERKKGLIAIFLGANQDAISTGNRFGFSKKTCITTGSDGATAGFAMGYVNNMCRAVSSGIKSNKEIKFTEEERNISAPRGSIPPPPSPSSFGAYVADNTGSTRQQRQQVISKVVSNWYNGNIVERSTSQDNEDDPLPPPPPPYLRFSLNRIQARPASPSYSPPPSHDPNMPYPLSTTPKSSHVSHSGKTILPTYTFEEEAAINSLLSLNKKA
tara:strand:+ start:375 stop:1520 length:1146 start_codon:yes stop_codon:yes gene_type:complete